MSGIDAILNMAKQSLAVQQKALNVTAHNISNVNTEGYSRQRPEFVSNKGYQTYGGIIGGGVDITSIQRVYDQFITAQLNDQISNKSGWEMTDSILREVESVLTEDEDYGLNKTLNEFWNAWADLANEPTGFTERSALISAAERLCETFRSRYLGLQSVQQNLDVTIQRAVEEINSLTASIADLNEQISSAEIGQRRMANDLRDQRDEQLRKLAEYIDFTTVVDAGGQVSVLLKNGNPLVSGAKSWNLRADSFMADSNFHQVQWENMDGARSDIMQVVGNGKLGALIKQRDSFIAGVLSDLDILAAAISQEVNRNHLSGYGLDGSTGNRFFQALRAHIWQDNSNTGSAQVDLTVYDETILTLHNYQVTFTSDTQFVIKDQYTGQDVATHDLAADGPSVYFEGMELRITGSAKAGDIYYISTTRQAAQDFAVSSDVSSHYEKIAASKTGDAGDNQVALDISDLQFSKLMSDHTSTFNEYLGKIIGDVGVEKQNAEVNVLHHEDILSNLKTMRETVSGVSIDEEMINLMKFQRAFQAAAKIITIMDEIYESLLSSLNR
jgi:flagellar hook-associated protein 1 FlgK